MTQTNKPILALLACASVCCRPAIVVGAEAKTRPNILWITSEDNSVDWISCYGATNAHTPHIDRLAEEGFRYLHCYDNAAVCAPTRSTWITGMHALSIGTHPMRSRYPIPPTIKYYNEVLQAAGYFTGNCKKTDYNLSGRDPKAFWDTWEKYGWRKRKPGQPFFHIINLGESHESRAFGDLRSDSKDPAAMKLAAYHPDLPEIRETYAIYAGAVEKMDSEVGAIIEALKDDGLYEDTIIIYNSDHGGVLPRSKRFLYESGVHTPLVIRIPEKWRSLWPAGAKPGMPVDRLVSFVDMPKTWISLAGGEVPDSYQGSLFLGEGAEPEPKYHFAWRGRADERYDSVRMIRNKRFAYHKNYMPYAPAGQFLPYMHRMKATEAWEQYYLAGKTNAITGRFFEPRVSEELYDNVADHDNVHNLIDDPRYKDVLAELKAELRRQQLKYFDSGLLPEPMIDRRAKANELTIYEMVRDPDLYPLADYLDLADLALARDIANLPALVEALKSADEGKRWWGVVGLLLLEKQAAPAVDALRAATREEAAEIGLLAAWALRKVGQREEAEGILLDFLRSDRGGNFLYNVVDWMGADSQAVLTRYCQEATPKSKFFRTLLARRGLYVADTGTAAIVPASRFSTEVDGKRVAGLTGEYFANKNLQGEPAATRVDKQIDFQWGRAAPHPAVPKDGCSVRWTGKLETTRPGEYTFVTRSDDGARLWVNGTQLVDDWTGHSVQDNAGKIRLDGNTEYDLRLEFFDQGAGATCRLLWIEPK